MGQSISINRNNVYKTHRFSDNMYIKLNKRVNQNEATLYENCFKTTMEPIFEDNTKYTYI